jgi:hypothetical protein
LHYGAKWQDNDLSRLGYLFRQLFRSARRLFQVLVGLAFMLLAAAGATVSFAEWQQYAKYPAGGMLYFVLYSSFTVLLLIFSLYSFAKARNIR